MYNPKFDLDLKFGEEYEKGLETLFKTKGKIEVKTERDKWIETGNIAIEIRCRGKKSGLSVTESDWWFHILSYEGKVKGMLCLPVEELKNICKAMIKSGEAKKIMGGDDNQSEILLLPIKTLVGFIGKLF
jgi:hypothetical protein|tara:strand:- start:239 stop:628 length:390 start_codon:yes stop_codon:yes gene_type:complete